jgi:hypothetical protein
VGVVPMTPAGQTEDKVAQDNQVANKTKGPFRRYSVNFAVDPAGLVFLRGADGMVHADFDLVIFVFSADGELLNSQTAPVRIAKPLDEVKKILQQGLLYHQEVSAPAKGEYFLRIGVHELRRDRYGVVEVSTSAVRDVKPPTSAQLGR